MAHKNDYLVIEILAEEKDCSGIWVLEIKTHRGLANGGESIAYYRYALREHHKNDFKKLLRMNQHRRAISNADKEWCLWSQKFHGGTRQWDYIKKPE